MAVKFNQVTWYSRLLAIFFIFGIFPCLVFFIGKKYQETVSVILSAEASEFDELGIENPKEVGNKQTDR